MNDFCNKKTEMRSFPDLRIRLLMGWRNYNPTTGCFVVADEYEREEAESTSLNRYLYAEGDPVNNIDPDGYAPKWLQKGLKATKKLRKRHIILRLAMIFVLLKVKSQNGIKRQEKQHLSIIVYYTKEKVRV
jgi:RHS repeat-associated protein